MRKKWIKTGREVEGFDKPGEGKEKLSSIAPQNRNNQSRLSYDYGNERGSKEGRKEQCNFFYEMSGRRRWMAGY